ncbi:hypothetical protein BIV25_17970 [Streptomyces sp. MUSC 14]|uniref:hypothetical protein n=1 Tax=Streptomyces sp. MUSC 14 TaxID=1354889 RepID=UPI0008F5E614|nr:hypothetical protein [Streptomyces sp. MUSC 14]OIJ96454.1 hypothetical protein BIV25_17970 [Streptomyces sp. MUSC 14]
MTAVQPPERPDESSIPDEQWEAFLREAAEDGGRNAPKEPSARAWMVARRLREQDEAARDQAAEGNGRRRWRKRASQPKPQSSLPPGWRTGPAWREMNGRSSRRRTVGSVIGVVLAAALAVVAVRPSLLLDRLPGRDHPSRTSAAPLPAETALPSGAPGAVDDAGLPTRKDPFLGSPAQRWADGADAIEVPPAKAVGWLSQADMAVALRRVKEFLVGANLDPAVLRGGRPTSVLALLDPQQKHPDELSDLRRSLRTPDLRYDPLQLVTRFAPAQVALAGDVVKARGHMTFSAGAAGEVRVHADYTFVYPLVRAGGKDGGADAAVARTIIRRDLTIDLLDPRTWIATGGKLTVRSSESEFYNTECDVHDGYFHPVFPDTAPTGAPATGPATDPYDRSKSVTDDHSKGCGTVTRT